MTLAVASDPAAAADPRALYGPQLVFDIYREDQQVGQHRAGFRAIDGGVAVRSTSEITLKALFHGLSLPLRQLGRMARGGAVAPHGRGRDNGDQRTIAVAPAGDGLRLTVDAGDPRVLAGPFPTNHWNAAVIDQGRVLNTAMTSSTKCASALAGAPGDDRKRSGGSDAL